MKQINSFFAALISVVMLCTVLPISALATPLEPDFILNGENRYWNEIDYLPVTSSDTIEIKTAPNKPMKIHIFSPDNSEVTIKGNSVNALNTYIIVDNDITLNLEDLKITAPSNTAAITLKNEYTEPEVKKMTLNIKGTCDVIGSGYGDGIFSDSDQKLVIKGDGILNTTGGDTTTQNVDGGRGINMVAKTFTNLGPGADLLIEGNVTVNARGGKSNNSWAGDGIIVQWGNMTVKSGTVNATSGAVQGVTDHAGSGIRVLVPWNAPSYGGKLTIEGGTVTATGGNAENLDGGKGVDVYNDLKINGGTLIAKGGDSKQKYGAMAISGDDNIDITGGTVTATGGKSIEYIGGLAIYSDKGNINITNATVTATGGSSTGTNGGVGIYAYQKDINITGGDVIATGGNGPVNGAHGIMVYTGKFGISNSANLTSNGGNGGTGVGGAGIRAFGYNDLTQSSSGNTVTISPDAGNVYVLGGQGATVRRPSIMGKDVFIATGNIGAVAMEGTNPRSIKNKPNGDDIYLLSVSTNPAAADIIVKSDVNGVLGGSYTYQSITKSDGIANMWLPSGSQRAYAGNYTYGDVDLLANDAQPQTATLYKTGAPSDVSAVAGNGQATVKFTVPNNGGSAITGYKVKVYVNGVEQTTLSTTVDVASITTTPATVNITGLTNGTAYTFKVAVANALGDNIESDASPAVTPKGTQSSPTGLTGVAPTSTSNNDGKITGVTTDMEYKLETATEWTAVTSADTTSLAAGTYEVRYKETTTKKASPSTTVIVPAYTSPSGGNSTPPTNTNNVIVIVNGKEESIGKAKTTTVNNQTQLTLTVDEAKLKEKLEAEGNNATVIIPVTNTNADVIVGQLNGQIVKNMEDKQATVIVQTDNASYTLPASQMNIDKISQQLGQNVDLKDIKIDIKIAKPADAVVSIVEDVAQKGNFILSVPPVEFTVTYTSGDKSGEVSRFNAYVERTIAIPDGVDPNKITTGIVVDPVDGTTYHVPTKIVQKDGKYYAVINSLTNSLYSVIWHPVAFNDVSNHWAKDAINNLGSRMVVNGVSEGTFAPNQDITRAQFATIMVRGLGLKPGVGSSNFGDVAKDAWYADYIATAAEYNLITGYTNGNFGPNDKITRQQAFAIIARAMALTDLKVDLSNTEVAKVLSTFKDTNKIATYAKPYVALAVQKGIVNGRGNQTIAPGDNITRAEVAVIIERLLQKSDLINN